MNTYIQDKLDMFDEKVNNTYEFFNATDGGGELQFTINEIDVDGVRNFIEQSLTDYHNHIVEKINKELKSVIKKKEQITNEPFHPARCQYLGQQDALRFVLSLLQDTNPKE